MSLRKETFERILAFSKLEEANHQVALNVGKIGLWSSFGSIFFSRYLKKQLDAGKRNGLELTGKKLEEFKMVKKKISELSIAYR